ncbi:hypothetical protein [Luteimonas sp. e5]
MNAIPTKQKATIAFLSLATAIYLGNYAAAQWHTNSIKQPLPEWPLAFDFFILLPLAYFIIFRPKPKKALLVFIGLVSLGVLVGSYVIPPDQKMVWSHIEKGRWLYLGALLLLQAAVVVSVGLEIYRNRHAKNIENAISQAISKKVPSNQIAQLLQADARVWTYAFVRNRAKLYSPPDGFFCFKHDSNASNQQAFMWLVAAEIPIAHVLIHLFSPTWAIIVTTVSIYGLIFLLSEYRATLLRATTLEQDSLHIRHGVIGDLAVPYWQIHSVQRENIRPRRSKQAIRFVGTGTANIRLQLKPSTTIETMLGSRKVATIYIGLDEPERFIREIQERLGA